MRRSLFYAEKLVPANGSAYFRFRLYATSCSPHLHAHGRRHGPPRSPCRARNSTRASIDVSSYDAGDALIFLWNFWWTRHALANGHNILDRPLGYPHGASLALHSYPLPYSLLSLPVQWLVPGAGLIVAFNIAVLLSFVLTAAAHLVLAARISQLRRQDRRRRAGYARAIPVSERSAVAIMATECPASLSFDWIVFGVLVQHSLRAIALRGLAATNFASIPRRNTQSQLQRSSQPWLMYGGGRGGRPQSSGIRSEHLAVAGISCAILIGPFWRRPARSPGTNPSRQSLDELIAWSPRSCRFLFRVGCIDFMGLFHPPSANADRPALPGCA